MPSWRMVDLPRCYDLVRTDKRLGDDEASRHLPGNFDLGLVPRPVRPRRHNGGGVVVGQRRAEAVRRPHVQTQDCHQPRGARDGRTRRPRRAGPGLAAAGRPDGRSAGGRLYPPPARAARDRRPQPDWAAVHRELRRSGVTLQVLWEEHRAVQPPTVTATAVMLRPDLCCR